MSYTRPILRLFAPQGAACPADGDRAAPMPADPTFVKSRRCPLR